MQPSFGVVPWPAKIGDGRTDEEDPDGDRCLFGNCAGAFPVSQKTRGLSTGSERPSLRGMVHSTPGVYFSAPKPSYEEEYRCISSVCACE